MCFSGVKLCVYECRVCVVTVNFDGDSVSERVDA